MGYDGAMRLLVTGAAGFIGTNFVRQALGADGDPAHGVTRLVAVDLLTYAGNLANLADLLTDPRVRFERCDIADREAMARLLRDEHIDVVVNFAAESHVDRSIVDQAPFLHTNVHGTLALLDATRDAGGVHRFLQVSTDEVYGSIVRGHATEDWPARPSSPLRGQQDGGGRLRARVCHHLRGAGGHHALLEQLRSLPVSREADPALRHQCARRRAAAALRRW
jgi:dTDP-glucose 4,6-dehydratase